ncbi:MAG: hypothetical protein HY909_02160 [Deltaproteobacteria bacterium]|nr:hypothetical protein [Deltaproteobacteria bacterium]
MRVCRGTALLLWAALPSVALADPRVLTHTDPAFQVTVPQGFTPCPTNTAAPDVLRCLQRRGPRGEALVLTLVRLQGEVPQGRLTVSELGGLRRADPFVFDDAREEARALGFTLDALAGHGTVPGTEETVFRVAAVLPLEAGGVLVTVLSPGRSEPEAREVFRSVLSSARGRSAWRRPWEVAVALGARVGATWAVVVTLGYALLALTLLRGSDRYRRQRTLALMSGSVGWGVLALSCMLLDGREGLVPAGVFASLGVSLAVLARKVGVTPRAC